MKLKELLRGVNIIECHADADMEIGGVSYDSRSTKGGDMFVAIAGYTSDGHEYIAAAVERGAVCVMCQRIPELDSIPYVLVDDTRKGLALASAHFFGDPAEKMKIVGVTGTNGKTTTTSLIKSMLEKSEGAKVGLIGTNCNMIGDIEVGTERTTPESYELQKLFKDMYEAGCEYVIMEVSSHALYLSRVYGINFEVGVFTNLTRDHLDFHKTMEEYGEAKALLFKQSKKGVINIDDEYAEMMIKAVECPVYTYSAKTDEADLTAKSIELKPDGVSFCALEIGKLEKVKLGIPGEFSVYNGLAAIATVVNLGIDLETACKTLSESHGVKGRAEVVPTGRDFTVIIDYAHTPDALENILKTVKGFAKGRVVALFGCGGDRDKTKRPIMGKIGVELADLAIITSDNPRTEDPSAIINDILQGVTGKKKSYKVIENRREAIGWALKNALPDDIILLAGKGHEDYQIIGKEKHHFDEREVVAEFLSQMQ